MMFNKIKTLFHNIYSFLFVRKKKEINERTIPIVDASDKDIADFSFSPEGKGKGNCCVRAKSGAVVVCPSISVKSLTELKCYKDAVIVAPAYKTYQDMTGEPFHKQTSKLDKLIEFSDKSVEKSKDADSSNN